MKLIELIKRKDSLLSVYCVRQSLIYYIKKAIGIDLRFENNIYLNNTFYIDIEEDEKALKLLEGLSKEDKFFLKNVIKKGYTLCKALIELSAKIKKLDLENKDTNELKNLYLDFIEQYKLANGLMYPPVLIEKIIISILEKKLSKKIDPAKEYEKFKKYMFILTAPEKQSPVAEEQKELLEICTQIKNLENLPTDKIKKHAQKYGWMNVHGFFGKPHDIGYYISRIREIKDAQMQLDDLLRKQKEFEKERKRILEEISPSKEFLNLIQLMQEYVYFRNFRRDAYSIAESNIRPLFEAIGKRLNLSYDNIICLSDVELLDFIITQDKKYTSLISERKCEFAVIGSDLKIYSGKELAKIKKKYQFLQIKPEEVKEIKGDAASRGKAKGAAKVVLEVKELNKIKEGDVLVTNMTTPEYVVAMGKASAIVTDRGGLLCHAAIVSRELGIPCIIGTNNATKLLHDGDLVEADAEKEQ